MLDELEPEVVLVYGGMPDSIFTKVKDTGLNRNPTPRKRKYKSRK